MWVARDDEAGGGVSEAPHTVQQKRRNLFEPENTRTENVPHPLISHNPSGQEPAENISSSFVVVFVSFSSSSYLIFLGFCVVNLFRREAPTPIWKVWPFKWKVEVPPAYHVPSHNIGRCRIDSEEQHHWKIPPSSAVAPMLASSLWLTFTSCISSSSLLLY